MSTRYAVAAMGLFLVGAIRGEEPLQRPNIVLIVADDLGWADLGCYGSRYHRTPNLDALAASGMRFTDAYAACPVCSPTRAALLTGLYPARLHLTDWLPGRPDRPDQKLNRPQIPQRLPAGTVTLPTLLKQAGYVTGHFGKWHLGGAGSSPTDHGFMVNIAGDHTGTPLSYFAPFRGRDGRFMPGLEKAPDGEYLTERLTSEAITFIRANRERPFFVYLPHYAVHTPLRAKPDRVAGYRPGKPGEQGNPIYAAMVEGVDDSVGAIVAGLRDMGLLDKTLVIFTSDNGGLCTTEGPNTPATINAPLREGKGYLYEGGTRVPLIVRGPGVNAGAVSSAVACSIDIMPTLLAACGVESPRVDGIPLQPALAGEMVPSRTLYWHYPHYANQGGRPSGSVRRGDWKLIEFYETGRRELFNLKDDPRESRNRAVDQAGEVEALATDLARWRTAVRAQMPTPNPSYRPNPPAANGSITLHARTAEVHGVQLRFEPLPHKNTLGYWTNEKDFARWEFTLPAPGTYSVEVLQGCGTGQGGSEVELAVGEQKVRFTVEDTGHFQNFKARTIGRVTIANAGRHTMTVTPIRKAAAAVMDLRAVTLHPVTR